MGIGAAAVDSRARRRSSRHPPIASACVVTLVSLALGCDDAAVESCSDGAALHVIDGHAYCVYAAGTGPDRGMCPTEAPTLVMRRGLTVCTDDPGPTPTAIASLCMERGVVCASEAAGWSRLAGTELLDVCPAREDLHGVVGCEAVVSGWSGGIADTRHDRMLVWGGGGGSNYFGNEVYALDVGAATVSRLTEPSDPVTDACVSVLPDGRPQSRATYDNLAFVEHAGLMVAWSGQNAGMDCGALGDTWTLDVTTREWARVEARVDPARRSLSTEGIAASDYDPLTRLVFLHDTYAFFAFELETGTYRFLADSNVGGGISYAFVGRVDLAARRFVVIGDGLARSIDLTEGADYAEADLALTGCPELVGSNYPGLAYDPVEQKLVGWAGGSTVYVVDAVADTCERRTLDGGPDEPQANGTNGRFRYFTSLDAFVLINAIDEDAWVLRLR
ncbi:MAG: hypothetical protein IT379_33475 [Deltaproteobacteria bacterium]|nr:hypothetical protein [Deltaproteobacteria bacterium]